MWFKTSAGQCKNSALHTSTAVFEVQLTSTIYQGDLCSTDKYAACLQLAKLPLLLFWNTVYLSLLPLSAFHAWGEQSPPVCNLTWNCAVCNQVWSGKWSEHDSTSQACKYRLHARWISGSLKVFWSPVLASSGLGIGGNLLELNLVLGPWAHSGPIHYCRHVAANHVDMPRCMVVHGESSIPCNSMPWYLT